MIKKSKFLIWTILSLIGWSALHLPAIFFGTQNLALHQSYVGDEQSPINGALHILKEKNPVGLRNLKTLYYGPVFAVIALPAVVGDFAEKKVRGLIQGGDDFKNHILSDWGGIVWKARLISIVTGFIGLLGLLMLLMTKTVNPKQSVILALFGTLLLAGNFFYFEYTSFFKHWIYLLTTLLWQLYLLVRIHENPDKARTYFIVQAVLAGLSFGLSYLALLSQILFIPSLIQWIKTKNKKILLDFTWYVGLSAFLAVVSMVWHPHAFIRILGLVSGDMFGLNTESFSSESTGSGISFLYYGKIIILNHLALLASLSILLWSSIKDGFAKKYLVLTTLSSAVVFYLIFGVMSHHESRYILPVIVLLATSTAILFVRHFIELTRMKKVIVGTLLACYLVFHGITIFHWTNLMKAGPSERVAIAEAVNYQKSHPEAKQLFVAWYLVGYTHTHEAYRDYAERFKKADANIYKALFEAEPLENSTPLNMYYVQPTGYPDGPTLNNDVFQKFDRVVYQYDPKIELKLEPDQLDLDIVSYWTQPSVWSHSYFVVKE